MDSFNLAILPASGNHFVSQLVILQHLSSINYVPNLILGSSGGNIAAYIAAAAEFQSAKIERIATDLKSSMFVTSWSDISIIAKSIGFFNGNMFDLGTGACDFLKKYFTPDTIQHYQILTGTYNKTLQRFRLGCNTSKKNSIIDFDVDFELNQTMETLYAEGNIECIAKFSLASASIPGIVTSIKINGDEYIDGGQACSSPVSLIKGPIVTYLKKHNFNLHITYINPKNLSTTNVVHNNNMFDIWEEAVSNLLRSNLVVDRLSAYELFNYQNVSNIHKSEFKCTYDNLIEMNVIKNKSKASMLEIFPIKPITVDITNFNGHDIKKAMNEIYDNCMCNFWWID